MALVSFCVNSHDLSAVKILSPAYLQTQVPPPGRDGLARQGLMFKSVQSSAIHTVYETLSYSVSIANTLHQTLPQGEHYFYFSVGGSKGLKTKQVLSLLSASDSAALTDFHFLVGRCSFPGAVAQHVAVLPAPAKPSLFCLLEKCQPLSKPQGPAQFLPLPSLSSQAAFSRH